MKPEKNNEPAGKEEELEGIVGQSNSPDGITLLVKGSVRYSCQICHHDAWISPGGQQTIKKNPTMFVVCRDCAQSGALEKKKGEPVSFHLPTREMLASDLGEEAADEILAKFKGSNLTPKDI